MIDNSKLCCMVDTARHVMQEYREHRREVTARIAGSYYVKDGQRKKTYINLLSLYSEIVTRNLISNNPRCSLSTFDVTQRPAVRAAETWLNQHLVKMEFAGTMERAVLDSLLGYAVVKIALASPQESAANAYGIAAGEVLASVIDLDDFVIDYRQRDFRDIQFVGHRYRVPLDSVMDSKLFSKKAKERIQPMTQDQYNREGDQRISTIGRGYDSVQGDLEDMVELWEIYIPRYNVIKTFTEADLSGPKSGWDDEVIPLREQAWVGPECGPYHYLYHMIVPGNLFPKGPIFDVVDLHDAANEAYRKLVRQSARLKVNSVCDANNPGDGEALNKANDGETVPVTNPKAVTQVVQGGPHAGLYQFTRELIDRFKEQCGNLDTLGGLASQAGTLGQEELLAKQSSGKIAAMQDKTLSFVTKCADAILWYAWHNPRLIMETEYRNPELPNMAFTRRLHPGDTEGDLMKRVGPKPDLKIEPYSLRTKTPQQRLSEITMFVKQMWAPLAQVAMSQGVTLNFNKMVEIAARNMDLPELMEVLTVGNGVDKTVGNSESSMPTQTSREYIRKDVGQPSGREQQSEMDNMVSAMAAAGNGQMNGQF